MDEALGLKFQVNFNQANPDFMKTIKHSRSMRSVAVVLDNVDYFDECRISLLNVTCARCTSLRV